MNKKSVNLHEKITEYGKKNNINALGFLKAKPFFRELERYSYAKEKDYLSSFVNKNPDLEIFKDFKSIICILISYPNPVFDSPELINTEHENKITGKISSSSWGRDYHVVLTEILNRMAEYIKSISNMKNYYVSVDTSPLSERELAVKAGLGWIGKNSNLINKELGSFAFIGALFTDIEILESDEHLISNDYCGECNLCVNACPVNAIDNKMRVINTKLCLSQQTQEKEIMNELVKEKIISTKYIYGCDICQEICPWNKEKRGFNPLFNPKREEVFIDLEELILESNSSFKNKYGHLAGSWRGKKTWQKNGKIILLNSN